MKAHNRLGTSILAAGLALGCAGLIAAQQPPSPPGDRPERPDRAERPDRPPGARGEGAGGPQRMIERMQETLNELNLSEEQKAKVKQILDKARADLQAAFKDSEGQEPRQRMEKIREIMQPLREEIAEVLDETQREKLRERMREGVGQRGGPGGRGRELGRPDAPPGGPPGPGERRDRRRPGAPGPQGPGGDRSGDPMGMISRLKENVSKLDLTDEQKQKLEAHWAETEKKITELRSEAEKMREKFREAMESNRQRLNEILTDEQRRKLREMLPPPPRPREDGARPDGRGGRGGEGAGERPRGDGAPAPQA